MQGLGAGLSKGDLDGVARFLEDFTVRALLPHMEARIRVLNHQVPLVSGFLGFRVLSTQCLLFTDSIRALNHQAPSVSGFRFCPRFCFPLYCYTFCYYFFSYTWYYMKQPYRPINPDVVGSV